MHPTQTAAASAAGSHLAAAARKEGRRPAAGSSCTRAFQQQRIDCVIACPTLHDIAWAATAIRKTWECAHACSNADGWNACTHAAMQMIGLHSSCCTKEGIAAAYTALCCSMMCRAALCRAVLVQVARACHRVPGSCGCIFPALPPLHDILAARGAQGLQQQAVAAQKLVQPAAVPAVPL
jgi:hypothetical protein